MKNRGRYMMIMLLLIAFIATPTLTSCGSLHSYWGVENDYYYDSDGHRHKGHRPKPPKKKKHKKHKKHHKHHDHDDWDD